MPSVTAMPGLTAPTVVRTAASEAENGIPELRDRVRRESRSSAAHLALGLALRRANFKHFGTQGLGMTNYHTVMYKSDPAQLRESAAELRKAIRLKPQDAWGHYFLGKDWADLGVPRRAVSEYRRAISLLPPHLLPGRTPSPAGRLNDSDGLYYDPSTHGVYNELGDALQSLGRYTDAITAYQTALRLSHGDAYTLLQIGIASNRAGRRAQAVLYWSRLNKISGGSGAYGLQARDLLKKYASNEH